jgi:hypothetical protein
MRLDQLMNVWARKEGLKEKDVLDGVKEHMFHEDGNLRFSIDHDNEGRIKIRVLPKRNKWANDSSTPTWKGSAQRSASWAWGDKQTPEKRAPVMRGSIARGVVVPKAVPAPKALSTSKKLDMPLNELINNEKENISAPAAEVDMEVSPQVAAEMWSERTAYYQHKTANVYRAVAQMGLTGDTSDLRLPSRFGRNQKGQGKGAGKRNGRGAWGAGQQESPRQDSPLRGRRSRSPSAGEEDDDLAEAARRSLRVADDRPLAGTSLGESKGKPPPPPGEHWTKYEDEGTIWYYYKGPLGQWWCQADSTDVQPYDDEE